MEQNGIVLPKLTATDLNPESRVYRRYKFASSEAKAKENFQKLLFPEGIYYNKQTSTFRTTKINLVFQGIEAVKGVSEGNKHKQRGVNSILSVLVGREGQISNLFLADLAKFGDLSRKIGKS